MKAHTRIELDTFKGLFDFKPLKEREVKVWVNAILSSFDVSAKDIPIFLIASHYHKVAGIWNKNNKELVFYTKNYPRQVEWRVLVHECAHILHQLSPIYNKNYNKDSSHGKIHMQIMHDICKKLMAENMCPCGILFNTTFNYSVNPIIKHKKLCEDCWNIKFKRPSFPLLTTQGLP